MDVYNIREDELFLKFHTKAKGLSAKEANRRLVDFGSNEIQGGKKKELYKRVF